MDRKAVKGYFPTNLLIYEKSRRKEGGKNMCVKEIGEEILERMAKGDFNLFEFVGYCVLKREGVKDIEEHYLSEKCDDLAEALISWINREYEDIIKDMDTRDEYFNERMKTTMLICILISLFYDYDLTNLISPDITPDKKFIRT
jgi:hypothetical protein